MNGNREVINEALFKRIVEWEQKHGLLKARLEASNSKLADETL